MVKRSGATEPFSRAKVVAGVRKACQGRPVTEDDLALLAQRVEEAVRAAGAAEVDAHEVGLAILGPLRELDEVAYLRFASVYRAFESLEDFEAEIALLRAEREPLAGRARRRGEPAPTRREPAERRTSRPTPTTPTASDPQHPPPERTAGSTADDVEQARGGPHP